MELSDLKQNNPRQYYDLVASGKISYADAGALVWGAPVTNAFAEGFLGGPFPPDYRAIAEPSDFSTPTTLAASGAYPNLGEVTLKEHRMLLTQTLDLMQH